MHYTKVREVAERLALSLPRAQSLPQSPLISTQSLSQFLNLPQSPPVSINLAQISELLKAGGSGLGDPNASLAPGISLVATNSFRCCQRYELDLYGLLMLARV